LNTVFTSGKIKNPVLQDENDSLYHPIDENPYRITRGMRAGLLGFCPQAPK
jgi:hypothetical protein